MPPRLRSRITVCVAAVVPALLAVAACAKTPETAGSNEVSSEGGHPLGPPPSRAAGSGGSGGSTPGSTPPGTGRGGLALPPDAAALAAAAEKTTNQNSAHFTLAINQQTAGGEVPSTSGEGDYGSGRTHATLSVAGGTGGGGGAAASGFAGLMGGPVELITDGTTIYFKSPLLGSLLGDPDATWLAFSATEPATTGFGGSIATQLPFGGAISPASFLDSLKTAGDVKLVGPEDLGGVPTTRYSATIDSTQNTEPGVSKFGGQTYHEDVWIDGDGIVRRVSYVVDGNKVAASTGLGGFQGPLHITFDLSAVGQPVDIQVPPPEQVTSAGDLSNLGAGGLGG